MAKASVIARAQKKPKYSTRKVNRCWRCGRKRGYMRDFGLCRICFRELATKGSCSLFKNQMGNYRSFIKKGIFDGSREIRKRKKQGN